MGKGNPKTLIQYNGQTPEQARENGRKGGLASGVARQRRKLIRETINEIMPLEVADQELRAALLEAGLEPTYEVAMSFAAIKRAAKGDIEAARFIRDTRGEKPAEGLVVGQLLDAPVGALDMSKLSDAELRAIAYRAEERESLPPAQRGGDAHVK